MDIVAFLRLGRPHFLIAGFVMYALGALASHAAGAQINLTTYFLGQAFVTATQWKVHYANEYHDLEADRANLTPTKFAGGSRMLVEERIAPNVALYTARVFGILAIIFGVVFIMFIPDAMPAIVATFVLAWGYNSPPLQLQRRGLGQPTVLAIVAGLVPLLGFMSGGGAWSSLFMLVPIGSVIWIAVLALDLPDMEGDRAAGKLTLAVRIGDGARWLALFSIGPAVIAAAPWMDTNGIGAAFGVVTTAFAVVTGWALIRKPLLAAFPALAWSAVTVTFYLWTLVF